MYKDNASFGSMYKDMEGTERLIFGTMRFFSNFFLRSFAGLPYAYGSLPLALPTAYGSLPCGLIRTPAVNFYASADSVLSWWHVKRHFGHERKNRTSCQSLSIAPAASPPYGCTPYWLSSLPLTLPYTVLAYFNEERLIFFSKMVVTENKFKQKHCISCTFTLMHTTKKMIFDACACIVRRHVLICYVNTCLQRNKIRFFKKVLSVVSDPRNVLRDKQGRLTV